MPRTPITKRVKSLLISRTFDIASGGSEDKNAIAAVLIQDDITVIGCYVEARIRWQASPAFDEGQAYVRCEFSRVGVMTNDGAFLAADARCVYGTELVGATNVAITIGNLKDTQTMFFPEGYGVDIDDGEYLYMNMAGINEIISAGSITVFGEITVFYVER